MIQHHNWSLTELENMLPWEREVYAGLLYEFLKEQEEEKRKEQAKK